MTACAIRRGYSLPELIIALGILTILGTITLTHYRQLKSTGDPAHAAVIYADALREAQQHAVGQDYDSNWGAIVGTSSITVFNGTSYAARTTSRDRVYWLPNSLTVSGATTTVFTKFTGLPDAAATSTFKNAYAAATTTVSAGGAVGYIH